MEKARKKELLENFCCKEVIFAILCIIACVVLFFVRARFPAGTVIRAALGGGGGQCWPSGHPGAVSERPANPALALVTVRGDRV